MGLRQQRLTGEPLSLATHSHRELEEYDLRCVSDDLLGETSLTAVLHWLPGGSTLWLAREVRKSLDTAGKSATCLRDGIQEHRADGPLLYVLESLPAREHATLAEIMTAYPNREYLVEAEIDGQALKELLALQASLLSYQQAQPFWVRDVTEMRMEQVEDKDVYHIVTSELVCEGGLGWGPARSAMRSHRNLEVTCWQIVQDYLAS